MSSDSDSDGWTDEEPEMPLYEDGCRCLLCPLALPSPEAVFAHCGEQHGFHLASVHAQHPLSFYSYIQLVNFVRRTVENGSFSMEEVLAGKFLCEENLKTHLQDDSLLCFDIDSYLEPQCNGDTHETLQKTTQESPEMIQVPKSEYESLKRELADLRRKLVQSETLMNEASREMSVMRDVTQRLMECDDVTSGGDVSLAASSANEDPDQYYFDSYASFSIHEEMLKDTVRTESYRSFIMDNPALFRSKTVLDVGCGTGILSLFAAQSGARQVFAVDQSNVAASARAIVQENGLQETVQVIQGKVEKVALPVKFDVIISEWMGYFLLFECMLDSVIYARDHLLRPGGTVYPRRYSMALCGIGGRDSSLREKVAFWDDVYGFKMSCIKQQLRREALVTEVKPESVVTSSHVIKHFDLLSVEHDYTDFESPFTLKGTADSDVEIEAICGYFDVDFAGDSCETPVAFSTGPGHAMTHWQQIVFSLSRPMRLEQGGSVRGGIKLIRNPQDTRSLLITITTPLETSTFALR